MDWLRGRIARGAVCGTKALASVLHNEGAAMFGWLRRKKISGRAKRRLMIALARAEEDILETHVANALAVMDALDNELSMGHALELYLEAMDLGEVRETIVAKRVLARLEEEEAGRMRAARASRYESDEDEEDE
jgi:hypothetical protein